MEWQAQRAARCRGTAKTRGEKYDAPAQEAQALTRIRRPFSRSQSRCFSVSRLS